MPSINSVRYAQRIIQTESHESPSFLGKVHRLDPPTADSDTDTVSVTKVKTSEMVFLLLLRNTTLLHN